MANLADAQTAMLSPAGAADLDLSIIGTKLVLVVDSRELARACLAHRIHNALYNRPGRHGGAFTRGAVSRNFRSYLAGVGGYWDGLGRGSPR